MFIVHIDKTLDSIFVRPKFLKQYIEHNESHVCIPNIYKYFCCGQTYQTKNIFRNENVIQIKLGIDDFEVCSPLKSKTGSHMMCTVYSRVVNIPTELLSKQIETI